MHHDLQNSILNLSYTHLRTFQLVASGISARQAAEQLHRTQPAISLSIREMESRLGHPLFDRHRKMELTPFGQACLPVINAYLLHHAKMSEELERLALGGAGTVSMGTIPIASGWLAKAVAQFKTQAPDAHVTLRSDNVMGLKERLRKGEIDFCVCTHLKQSPEFSFKPITQSPFGLICHRNHLLAGRSELSWKDLSGIRLIESALLKEEFACESIAGLKVDTILAANLQIMNALLEEEVGVTVMAQYAMPRKGYELVFIPLQDPVIYSTLGILKLANAPHNPAARRLEGIVEACLTKWF